MNNDNLEQTKKANNQPVANRDGRDGSDATNSDAVRMYDANSMVSGAGDATEEERNKIKAQSAASNENKKK